MNKQTTPIEDQLDEILEGLELNAKSPYLASINNKVDIAKMLNKPEAKTKLLNLFAHLASEAKPLKMRELDMDADVAVRLSHRSHNQGIDTYEQNILKAIGRQS